MEEINIFYGRVSLEEDDENNKDKKAQNLDSQFDFLSEYFNFDKFDHVIDMNEREWEDVFKHSNTLYCFTERGSAYQIDKLKKRKQFLKIFDFVFDWKNYSAYDYFIGKSKPKYKFNIYTLGVERLMRNFELSDKFSALINDFNVKIITYKNGIIEKKEEDELHNKMSNKLLWVMNSFGSAHYSNEISKNVKKSLVKKGNIYTSKDGKKVGVALKDIYGNVISIERQNEIMEYVKGRMEYHENKGIRRYYNKLLKELKNKYDFEVSKTTLTEWKNKLI